MTNEIVIITEEDIRNKIYVIRGIQVMLDSDLAKLYKCKNGTKTINQAVKRHLDRFPSDFYFQLTEEEYLRFQNGTLKNNNVCDPNLGLQNNMINNLKSQSGTSSLNNNYGGVRKLPYVFTEQGVAMLSSVLRTEVASKVSINIMRAFVTMRHLLLDKVEYQKELFIIQNKVLEIDNKLIEHDSKFEEIFTKFDSDDYLKNKLIFENHIYDAYSFLLDILNEAKEEIIIIDNYCDKEVLDLICNLKVNVTIISKNMNDELIKKYQTQYDNLTIKYNDIFHDRFIILDKKKVYQLGSSLKDLGKKCSYISNFDNENDTNDLIKRINFI